LLCLSVCLSTLAADAAVSSIHQCQTDIIVNLPLKEHVTNSETRAYVADFLETVYKQKQQVCFVLPCKSVIGKLWLPLKTGEGDPK